jgi:CheY-like chemotaxis protein
MIKVKLITSKNNAIEPYLRNEGLASDELALNNNISSVSKADFTLLEIPELNKDTAERITEIIMSLDKNSRLVCFCEIISHDIKKFLLKNGIADCVEGSDPGRIAGYIKHLTMPDKNPTGTFLILDDNTTHKKILSSIINRFSYRINFISSIDELFETINEHLNIMLLINMGTENLDMNAVVRKSYNNPDIKRIPVVAYKSMEQGLYVHEIINGLNRLTKIIMSPEELYCMLTDMLFKKEIISITASYTGSLKYARFSSYAGKSLQQIYYEIQSDPCAQDLLFERNTVDSMIKSAEEIRSTHIKAEGIRWLTGITTQKKQATCGEGV